MIFKEIARELLKQYVEDAKITYEEKTLLIQLKLKSKLLYVDIAIYDVDEKQAKELTEIAKKLLE